MDGETARALRRRLLVVPVAVSLVLLTTVRPTGGHAGLLEEGCSDAPSAYELKELLYLAGGTPGLSRAYWPIESPTETTVWHKPAITVIVV